MKVAFKISSKNGVFGFANMVFELHYKGGCKGIFNHCQRDLQSVVYYFDSGKRAGKFYLRRREAGV
jgi:hypothetical protein